MEHFDQHVIAQLKKGIHTTVSRTTSTQKSTARLTLIVSSILCISFIILGACLWFADLSGILKGVVSAEIMQTIAPSLESGLHYSIASVTVTLFTILLYLNVRRYYSGAHFWSSACPECDHHKLVRIKRKRWQRLTGAFLRLPIRHFGCKQCNWRGSRIDRAIFQ